ncbi:signal peptidase I [Streptomyces sp. AF1B]|jgi:signal peptidase I|uniref:signal peptidase I n=1 Tax=Streptomyces sp. AF1B TaxID=3399503 RepID=UPI003AABB58A
MSGARKLGIWAGVLGSLGVVLAVVAAVALWTGFHGSTVSSSSMAPTYKRGQQLMYERVKGTEVRRGDVVLYSAPDRYGFDAPVMQRVIGVGGDHIVCCTGQGQNERLTVNGKPLAEPYVADGIADGVGARYDVKVPRGRLFMLGDHRTDSADSRFFASDHDGTVPVSAVRGRVTDDYTEPAVLGVAALVGLALALTGIGLGIAAVAVRKRVVVPPPPPWAVQV